MCQNVNGCVDRCPPLVQCRQPCAGTWSWQAATNARAFSSCWLFLPLMTSQVVPSLSMSLLMSSADAHSRSDGPQEARPMSHAQGPMDTTLAANHSTVGSFPRPGSWAGTRWPSRQYALHPNMIRKPTGCIFEQPHHKQDNTNVF